MSEKIWQGNSKQSDVPNQRNRGIFYIDGMRKKKYRSFKRRGNYPGNSCLMTGTFSEKGDFENGT